MRRLLLALGATALLALAAPTAAAQDGPPTVTVDRTGAAAGEPVLVEGAGWTGTELVYVELCGNGGRGGSSSCHQANATLAGVSTTGSFGATLVVAEPPVPCPCVIKATSQSDQSAATAPLAVQDVPVVPLEDQTEMNRIERAVEVSAIELEGSGPWTAWLGAGASRTLSFTIENVGDVAVHDPPVTVTIGKGATPGGVVRAPELGSIEPGESVDVDIPVTYDALSFGRHSAVVKVDGFATPAVATAHTSTYPWALIAIGLVLLQLILLRIRNRIRRRFERSDLADEWGPDADDKDADIDDGADIEEEIDLRDGALATSASTAAALAPSGEPEHEPAHNGAGPHAEESVELQEPDFVPTAALVDLPDSALAEEASATSAVVWPAVAVTALGPAPESEQESVEEAGEDDARAVTVVDLRDPSPIEIPEGMRSGEAFAAGAALVAGEHDLPNPFEYVARHMVTDSDVHIATRPRANGHRSLAAARDEAWIADRRRELQAIFDDAEALAEQLLTAAQTEAERVLTTAATTRDQAAEVLDRARAKVERILITAEEEAAAIRREAAHELESTRAATEASRAEVARMMAEARTGLAAKMAELEERTSARTPVEALAVDLVAMEPAPRPAVPRIGSGFDTAIARAVQQALRG
ncbi:MAG: hypothetical protein ACSLFP_04185 [Acidimicrobiales bacterium]